MPGSGSGASDPAPDAREDGDAAPRRAASPVPDRLYGRRQGHPLRARQQRLLDAALPRLSLDEAAATADLASVSPRNRTRLWLEVGFGGGEHAEALARANPGVGLIASRSVQNGICSLLTRLVPEGAEDDRAGPAQPALLVPRRPAPVAAPAGSRALSRLYPDVPGPLAQVAPRQAPLRPSGDPAPGGTRAQARRGMAHRQRRPDLSELGAGRVRRAALLRPVLQADERPQGWPGTRYEAKALRAGRVPRYWVWRRI